MNSNMSLYSTPLTAPFNSDPIFSEELLRQLENDKQLVDRIRRQRLRAQQLKQGLDRKQTQIMKISSQNKQLNKIRPYYQKFHTIKEMLDQTIVKLESKQTQNAKLTEQLQSVMIELEISQRKLNDSDKNRLALMKQRSQLQRLNSQIQQTFLQYKTQCKNKQAQLLSRLEKSYRLIKNQKKLVDQLEEAKKQLTVYKRKCQDLQSNKKAIEDQKSQLLEMLQLKQKQLVHFKKQDNSQTLHSRTDQRDKYHLSIEVDELKRALLQKQKQLQKSRRFNHQLSIQYDSSVNKNVQFESQLKQYRRQNHELKKQLSLFIEKQQYQQFYRKQALDQSIQSQQIDHLSSKHM